MEPLSFSGEGSEFRMFFEKVIGKRANHIYAKGILLGILKGGRDELESDSFAPRNLGDFGVPDGHPAMTIRFEFEIADLPILFDLEPAFRHFHRLAHSVLVLRMIQRAATTHSPDDGKLMFNFPHLATRL